MTKFELLQYLIQQIGQSVINNHLSFMFLLNVSMCTRSYQGGKYKGIKVQQILSYTSMLMCRVKI
jgi:predicted amino acid-binding ACT domain protein